MGAEEVRDRPYESFGGGEVGIGAWSDRVRDSGCGVFKVSVSSLGLELRRVNFDVLYLKQYMTSDYELTGTEGRDSDDSSSSSKAKFLLRFVLWS